MHGADWAHFQNILKYNMGLYLSSTIYLMFHTEQYIQIPCASWLKWKLWWYLTYKSVVMIMVLQISVNAWKYIIHIMVGCDELNDK